MEEFAAELLNELDCKTVFTIPILGGIAVDEAVVVTWILMAAVTLLCIILVRKLKVENPGKKQLALESAVAALNKMMVGMLGEEGKEYATYMACILIYIGIANLSGLLGFKPPTKDMNVTAALALMSIILIEAAGIRKKGFGKWVKSFGKPTPVIAPLNVLEVFIRPLSLCMRLFGNVLGAFVVMKLIELILPVGLPVVFSVYFDIFDGLIQAYVFVFLTSLFINEQVEADN